MKTYGGHWIIENAEKLSNQKKTDVRAQSSEKFINIEFDSLSVKASFSFVTPYEIILTKYENTDEKGKRKRILREN